MGLIWPIKTMLIVLSLMCMMSTVIAEDAAKLVPDLPEEIGKDVVAPKLPIVSTDSRVRTYRPIYT